MNNCHYSKKQNLVLAYRILSYLNLDDHTYTHLSARDDDIFYINKFGCLFQEINEKSLVAISLVDKDKNKNEIVKKNFSDQEYNHTGSIIHGSIYRHRKDINYIYHLHVPEIVAVSLYGLMPISQWALHFYDRLSYSEYDSLALCDDRHGTKIAEDLKDNKVMLLRHHGAIICGKTAHEALFYAYHLYMACKTQCLSLHRREMIINEQVAESARNDLLSFEKDLGKRDWLGWLRLLKDQNLLPQFNLNNK